jgi:hypothetical protein
VTRCALTNLSIKREVLRAEARQLREARDMAGVAKVEAGLRDVTVEILRLGMASA